MDEAIKKQAQEWFERGRRDFETAKLLYVNRGYADSIAYHIHQAIEKFLKGYLVFNGAKPPRIHELDTLLNKIIDFDKEFIKFLELCEKTSLYYFETRYPPGPPVDHDLDHIKSDMDGAGYLIDKIINKAGFKAS